MTKLDELMTKEVTRRQFLLTLVAGLVGLFGLSSLMGILTSNQPRDEGPADYGMRNYGP